MGLKSAHRGGIEKVILLVIFVGLLVFVTVNYMKERQVTKEKTLYYQLESMRQGINLFQINERKYPKGLIELAAAVYQMPGSSKKYKYVADIDVDKAGKIVDPFGKPYKYNSLTGWVESVTSGYTDW